MEAPATAEELAATLAAASEEGQPVRVRGGGTLSRHAPGDDALTLSTAGLAEIAEHTPADLTITVGAGLPVADLEDHLSSHSQEWPQHGAREGSTVGGVLASAASGTRRLAHGPVRDSLLEVVLATGDGRLVRGGGKTVKNVSGYDLPRLAVGSWGVLGVLVEVTLKLWPTPPSRAWFAAPAAGAEREALGAEALASEAVASVVLTPGRISVERAGQPDDVVAISGLDVGDEPGPPRGDVIVRGGVAPGTVAAAAAWLEERGLDFQLQAGVGALALATRDAQSAGMAIARIAEFGGHAEVIDAPPDVWSELAPADPAGLPIMRRLKETFDPAGVINPGMLCGAI